jgi:hypothetical protein
MKAPNLPSLSESWPAPQVGQARGSPPSAFSGKMWGPSRPLSASRTSATRNSLVPPIAAEKSRQKSRSTEREKKRLQPEDKGRLVTGFLESFFKRYVEYDFTASLEEQLDRVSNAEIDWRSVLRDFWRDFSAAIGGTKE